MQRYASAIADPNFILEHRWLHFTNAYVPQKKYLTPINKAKIINKGEDLTIVAMSYLVQEALIAKTYINRLNINPEIIDLRSIKPIDYKTIIKSIKKTKRMLVLDTGFRFCSVSSEIISSIVEKILTFKNCTRKVDNAGCS